MRSQHRQLAIIAAGLLSAGSMHPRAQTIELSPGDDIRSAITQAGEGAEIVLAAGDYAVDNIIQVRAAGVTIRSQSGDRSSVILDGNRGGLPLRRENFTPEILQIRASDVTIADVTIRYAGAHGIHASGAADHTIANLVMRNIHVHDCGEQLIKVNSNGNADNLHWVDGGLLENSLVEFIDNSVMRDMGSYFYTGGLDVHGSDNWIVRNNTFRGIWREDRMMEHAIHFWSRSRNTLIENNTFVNCWRAIGLGMKTSASGLIRSYDDHAGENPFYDHVGGMIRNNVIYNDSDHRLETGIELMNVLDTEVYHNTVVSLADPFNSIEYRWPDTRVTIKNNLCTHRILARNDAIGDLTGNIENARLAWFADYAQADLHLSAGAAPAIDNGVVLADGKAGRDIDGDGRGDAPDIGADERNGEAVSLVAPARSRIGNSPDKLSLYDCLGRRESMRLHLSAPGVVLSVRRGSRRHARAINAARGR
jgi:hypothetical protein